jgi:hypothetical protein
LAAVGGVGRRNPPRIGARRVVAVLTLGTAVTLVPLACSSTSESPEAGTNGEGEGRGDGRLTFALTGAPRSNILALHRGRDMETQVAPTKDQKTAVPCASGMAVLDMRWAIEKMLGASILKLALERVTPSAREEYMHATPLSWVTYGTLAEVHDAVAAVTRVDAMVLADKLARLTVERSFTTVWRIFLRFTSDEAIIVRTPAFYAKSRSVGYMASRILEPGKSESIVSGFPTIPQRDIVILAASIETVITLAGRKDVKSSGERMPDGARFITRWQV